MGTARLVKCFAMFLRVSSTLLLTSERSAVRIMDADGLRVLLQLLQGVRLSEREGRGSMDGAGCAVLGLECLGWFKEALIAVPATQL